MDIIDNLIDRISDKNNKVKYNRQFFKHKIFPFFTREPERVKYKNGFQGILGATSRISLSLQPEYQMNDHPISTELLDVDFVSSNLETDFLNFFTNSQTLSSLNHPFLINYLPNSDGNDIKGEVEIALLLNQLLDLHSRESWKEIVGDKEYTNLFEKIIMDSIVNLKSAESKNDYIVFNKENFKYLSKDLEYLTKNKDFFMRNIGRFLAFYYFQYLIQTSLYLNNFENTSTDFIPLYFTLDSEKITSTRQSVKQGFNMITNLRKDLLVNENIIGYLNFLNESENTYPVQDLINSKSKDSLNEKLELFIKSYESLTEKNNSFDVKGMYDNKLLNNIYKLKKYLLDDIQLETQSRYFKSIDEIGNLYFLKSRGKLGKILTLDVNMIILLTTLIVKDEKVILSNVFIEFERRGVWFDRYTKEKIVDLYEKINILEKKSDSGEAKYVKPIL